MKDVSIILPISLTDEVRKRAFNWVRQYYEHIFPDVDICIGINNERPFSKAKVINEAVRESKGEILVIADADIFYDPTLLTESIKQLEHHAWVIPFNRVLNISKRSTDRLLSEEPTWPIPIEIETKQRKFGHQARGGVNIVPREHFEMVEGFDERFIGWGGEDDAFAMSLNQVCGSVKRLNGTLYHFWHSRNNAGYYKNNREILKHYFAGKESILKQIELRRENKR
ncbi:galactosyltransferase-related protein [Aquisalibacillus elongatus]|uniref:Glycosyl transferase family 2 n=1 Tax=Aquisalibacillus elongatus TaxID=485577 RepID=A0A3N5B0K9_9BACI|nr:galactosyltransferase-related protein [Aquisalibacillus elongatus]RPF50699.1 glycosyl transferase family 2 [Aquisalibacillus elongatus]